MYNILKSIVETVILVIPGGLLASWENNPVDICSCGCQCKGILCNVKVDLSKSLCKCIALYFYALNFILKKKRWSISNVCSAK